MNYLSAHGLCVVVDTIRVQFIIISQKNIKFIKNRDGAQNFRDRPTSPPTTTITDDIVARILVLANLCNL